MKMFAAVLAALLVGAVATIGLSELVFRQTQHYAPAYEGVRRQTFEQSRAYQEGTIRDLENLQLAYASGNDAQKAAIRSVAQHRLADVDPTLLTPSLRQFAAQLGSDQ